MIPFDRTDSIGYVHFDGFGDMDRLETLLFVHLKNTDVNVTEPFWQEALIYMSL